MTLSDVEGHFIYFKDFYTSNTSKVLRSCVLYDAELILFAIAKFFVLHTMLVCRYLSRISPLR